MNRFHMIKFFFANCLNLVARSKHLKWSWTFTSCTALELVKYCALVGILSFWISSFKKRALWGFWNQTVQNFSLRLQLYNTLLHKPVHIICIILLSSWKLMQVIIWRVQVINSNLYTFYAAALTLNSSNC